jgi:hypothetical protein
MSKGFHVVSSRLKSPLLALSIHLGGWVMALLDNMYWKMTSTKKLPSTLNVILHHSLQDVQRHAAVAQHHTMKRFEVKLVA